MALKESKNMGHRKNMSEIIVQSHNDGYYDPLNDEDFTKLYLSKSKSRDDEHENDAASNSLRGHFKPLKEANSQVKKGNLYSNTHRRNKSQIEGLKKKATILGGKVKRIKKKIKNQTKVYYRA
jgi:hypothetical protein